MADPLTVPCPDCAVLEGTECATSIGYLEGSHAERQRHADLRAVEHGTCALCGQAMVRGVIEDAPLEAWHPDAAHAAVCPPIPSPQEDPAGWSAAINAGLTPGHPGVGYFLDAEQCAALQRGETVTVEVPVDANPGRWGTPPYDATVEQGRVLVSQREDLVAAGVDPADLLVPHHPPDEDHRPTTTPTEG